MTRWKRPAGGISFNSKGISLQSVIAGAGNAAIDTGTGIWNTTTANWTTDAGANNVAWVNVAHAVFGSGAYPANVAAGVSVEDLTVAAGAGNVTFKAVADNWR